MTPSPFARLARITLLVLCSGLGSVASADTSLTEVQALLRQAQYPAALSKADELLAAHPKDPQLRFAKGVILTELNRPNDAIAVYQALIKDFPELPEPYNNLAVIYASQKQYDKAKGALEMAIRTHPAYATAHENLGDVYAKLASQAYDKALQLDSGNTQAQTKLAQIRDLMGTGNRVRTGVAAAPAERPVQVAAAEPPKPAKPVPAAAATPAPAPAAKPAASVVTLPQATASKPAAAKPEVVKPEVVKTEPVRTSKPEPKPVSNAEAVAEAEARKAILSWASAWSRKDVKAYLGHYAADFRTPNGIARKAWEAERESRLSKPGKIQVEIDNLKFKVEGNQVTARFRQSYDSSNLKSSSGKTLVLQRHDGRWLIQQERIGG